MPVIAQWGAQTFEVSPQKVLALEGLSTGLKLKKENNNDDNGSPPTNVKAYELQSLSFEVPISDAVGVDVRHELEEWMTLVGEVAPFYLGGHVFGPENIQLIAVELGDSVTDDFGRLRYGVLSLSFQEWAQEAAGQKNKPGTYVTIRPSTAVNVGASAADKASKKLVSI